MRGLWRSAAQSPLATTAVILGAAGDPVRNPREAQRKHTGVCRDPAHAAGQSPFLLRQER